jgi:hypothetical protein
VVVAVEITRGQLALPVVVVAAQATAEPHMAGRVFLGKVTSVVVVSTLALLMVGVEAVALEQ